MKERKGKRTAIVLAVVVTAAVIVSAFVHAGEDDFLTDPARLTASWQVEEVWQNGKRVNRSLILIDIDKMADFVSTTMIEGMSRGGNSRKWTDSSVFSAMMDGFMTFTAGSGSWS